MIVSPWTEVSWRRWVRIDGAVVLWDDRSPHPNPENPSSRMWTAWEPDPSKHYLMMRRGRIRRDMEGELSRPGFPRRWKTARSAIEAVDREYPLKVVEATQTQ